MFVAQDLQDGKEFALKVCSQFVLLSSFVLLPWVAGLWPISSATHSYLQLPYSSPRRSCCWCHLSFVAIFFLLLLYPTVSLLLYQEQRFMTQNVSNPSFHCFAVFKILLFYSTFWRTSAFVTFRFSAKPTFQKLLASLCQPWRSRFLHHKEWCSTLCMWQSPCLNPNSVCLSEAIFLFIAIPHLIPFPGICWSAVKSRPSLACCFLGLSWPGPAQPVFCLKFSGLFALLNVKRIYIHIRILTLVQWNILTFRAIGMKVCVIATFGWPGAAYTGCATASLFYWCRMCFQ